MIIPSHSFKSTIVDPLSSELTKSAERVFARIQEALSTPINTYPHSYPHTHEQEIRVIVHKIKPEDTFAGIALFYDVPTEQLRKLNRLWSTDSIHWRLFLYIPLELVQYQQIYCKLKDIQPPELVDDTVSVSTTSTWEIPSPKSPVVPMVTISQKELRFFTNISHEDTSPTIGVTPLEDLPSLKDAFGLTYLSKIAGTLRQVCHRAVASSLNGGPTENYEL